MRIVSTLLLIVALTQLWGCAAYSIYDDKRQINTITQDKGIATDIKTKLMGYNLGKGWSTAVYCYYGKVFLVGEVPDDIKAELVDVAQKCRGVKNVTTHWFTPKTATTANIAVATQVRTELIRTEFLSSTRIDTEVNANRVVLLGVVNDSYERDLAVSAAKNTQGVESVTSYLMLPPEDAFEGIGGNTTSVESSSSDPYSSSTPSNDQGIYIEEGTPRD